MIPECMGVIDNESKRVCIAFGLPDLDINMGWMMIEEEPTDDSHHDIESK